MKAVIPPCFASGTTSAHLSTIRQHTDTQLVWEARIQIILLYHALYISESGSVRQSVATKITRSGHGQSPYWPRMLE